MFHSVTTMALPLSIGDILMLSQTAWKIGRAFAHGKSSAPPEFTEVEKELDGLSNAFKLFAETLHSDGGVLSNACDATVAAVDAILNSARRTLDHLDLFVERYQVIQKKVTSGGGFTVERRWSDVLVVNSRTFKWTTKGGDIHDLHNMLQMHTNSITLATEALQSRSVARLDQTVIPIAEFVATMHDRVDGDLGDKIDDLHHIIMSIASSTPSLTASDRTIGSGSERNSTSTASTYDRSPRPLDPQRPPRTSIYNRIPRHSSRSPPVGSPTRPAIGLAISGSPGRELSDDYKLEPLPHAGPFEQRRWDLKTAPSPGVHTVGTPQHDSAYGVSACSRREPSARRESPTLPSLFKSVDEENEEEEEALRPSPLAVRKSWRSSTRSVMLPPPALSADEAQPLPNLPATPSSFPSSLQNFKSNNSDVSHTQRSPATDASPASPAATIERNVSQRQHEVSNFERQLFRNAAILCDVRCRLVEYAQTNPGEPDPRFNVEMVQGCPEARVCVIRKRENRELKGSRMVTSIWSLSDDGEVRLQQKLPEMEETVPYCSYFDPEKVSLQPEDPKSHIVLKFHDVQWGDMLLEEKKTNWVNYYFVSEQDAVAFQSAVFGRLLIGSYRTTKTTVIHAGLKGAFAFEEQFANIEMLRLWEDDGISTPGAAGGVMALMHISSSFGEGCEWMFVMASPRA